jgi:multiple RNA-binding domain-containing protein 1
LKTTFSSKGIVTDLQLKYTKEGKFRGFAFVGFRTEEEASAARNYFHGTYIGAAKIDVRICTDLGDQKKPKERVKSLSKPFYSTFIPPFSVDKNCIGFISMT